MLTANNLELAANNLELTAALAGAEQALTARTAEVEALTSRLDVREARRTYPTIVVVSHVGGWQPRAGNEYRLCRMLAVVPAPGVSCDSGDRAAAR